MRTLNKFLTLLEPLEALSGRYGHFSCVKYALKSLKSTVLYCFQGNSLVIQVKPAINDVFQQLSNVLERRK